MAKILSKEEWRRRKRRNKVMMLCIVSILFLMILGITAYIVSNLVINKLGNYNTGEETITEVLANGEIIKQEYLTPNQYSRPQTMLKRINAVVVHYTANPGTTAENNRNYFEGLKDKKTTYASSHFVIGLEGEIIQCIPLTEESYASNDRNDDTVSIECCHPDETGKFKEETYESLVSLVATLCMEYQLKEKDIIRHYDVTGKLCPLYYVEHEEAWEIFKDDVMSKIEELKTAKPVV